jgi:hypothetical protein
MQKGSAGMKKIRLQSTKEQLYKLLKLVGIYMAAFCVWNLISLLGIIFKIDTGGDGTFFSELQEFLFGRIMSQSETDTLTASMFGITQSLLFAVLYGTYILRQCNLQGVYYFVRQKNRKKWFRQAIRNLFLITVLWSFLQVFTSFIGAMLQTGTAWDLQIFYLLILFLLVFVTFNSFVVLLVNVMSLYMGTVFSYIGAYAILIASNEIAVELKHETVFSYFLPTEIYILRWEPDLCNTVFEFIRMYSKTIINMAATWLMMIIIFSLTLYRVSRMDIGLENKEYKFL